MKLKLKLGFGLAGLAAVAIAQQAQRSWVSVTTPKVTKTREVNTIITDIVAGVPVKLTFVYTDTIATTNGVISTTKGEWTVAPGDIASWPSTLASGATNSTKAYFNGLYTRLDAAPEHAVLGWDKPERVTPVNP